MYALQLNWNYVLKQMWSKVVKTRAELFNAECRIWRSLFIEYIQTLYASILHILHSVIAGKYFSTNYWRFQAICRFCVKKVCVVRCRHVGYSFSATHCPLCAMPLVSAKMHHRLYLFVIDWILLSGLCDMYSVVSQLPFSWFNRLGRIVC